MDYSLIAVMGPTGAGKSTFINVASGSNQKVGMSLKSCTTEVTPTEPFLVSGKSVILLDTPGFDDTNVSDFDILEEIAQYMTKTYKEQRLLDGILYFHSIADRRMGGIAVRNLKLFQSLCGDDPLKSVVVVTNMWGLLPSPELGESRERELATDPDFFYPVIRQGAKIMRHTDSKESSHRILSALLAKHGAEVLAIQTEMVDDNLRLDETTAAAVLTRDFDAMIQNLERKIAKEQRPRSGETSRERKDREQAIRKMKTKIRELEDRKIRIRKRSGSLWVHAAFLRWVKSLFS